jgi:predicted ArsR family transcriptional regulator
MPTPKTPVPDGGEPLAPYHAEVLAEIPSHGEITLEDLRKRVRVTPRALGQRLRYLIKRGLVERRREILDGRDARDAASGKTPPLALRERFRRTSLGAQL